VIRESAKINTDCRLFTRPCATVYNKSPIGEAGAPKDADVIASCHFLVQIDKLQCFLDGFFFLFVTEFIFSLYLGCEISFCPLSDKSTQTIDPVGALCWMNIESTLNQCLNLNSTLIQRRLPAGERISYPGTGPQRRFPADCTIPRHLHTRVIYHGITITIATEIK
jgi:hypothetical protein